MSLPPYGGPSGRFVQPVDAAAEAETDKTGSVQRIARSTAESADRRPLSFPTPIQFTEVTSNSPPRLSKAFRLNDVGQLVSEQGGRMLSGTATRAAVSSIAEFAERLQKLGPSQALIFGVPVRETARIVTKGRLAAMQDRPNDMIARDAESFAWPSGPGIFMLDVDNPKDGEVLEADDVREIIFSVAPELGDAPQSWTVSASSCIFDSRSGQDLRGARGHRGHVAVRDATDIPRAGRVLADRLWLAGHGRIEVSKSGALLERTVVDTAVWQTNRFDFAGGAHCEDPLEQRRPAPVVLNAAAMPLDTRSALPDLTEVEAKRLQQIKSSAKMASDVLDRQRAAREAWIEEKVAARRAKDPNVDEQKLRADLRSALADARLMGDFEIELEDGTRVEVGQLLDDPDRYHGKRCRDPLEPDYRDDNRISWINLRNAGRPYIYSHAHGGRRFRLHRALHTMQLIRGELHRHVQRVLELMKVDGRVFERGGELVRVGEDGRVHPLTCEWLAVYLTGLIRFTKFIGNPPVPTPADCPLSLAKSVIAMSGDYGLPALRGVITAPTMRSDGRLLMEEGYDEESGLLLVLDDPGAVATIPDEPNLQEVNKALADLMHPFHGFPFVGPVDRGVLLAALLTATVRVSLPTAPGFLFSAPVAGSGKTLLAKSIARMASADEPSMLPPVEVEDELRKRLLAALREGRSVIVFDNIVGRLDSASLAAFVTATEWSDRVLGASFVVSIPNASLFLVTGNNVQLVGDLNRRLLTCRIDPLTDKPYRRAFDIDPECYVQEHRLAMVSAALVVLRGYLAHGRSRRLASDRTASFEVWSDLVRQAVIWVRDQALLDVADPCDSIDLGLSGDPEATKLEALLQAWHAQFGDRPKTVAEAIRLGDADDDFLVVDASEEASLSLRDSLVEVAGERGGINSRRLGRWIERHEGRIQGGLRFERAGKYRGVMRWRVAQR